MYIFSVPYISTRGRSEELTEEVLIVQVKSTDNPKEFFLEIKKLMGCQCDDVCTSQYLKICLCPIYTVRNMSERVMDIYFRKFSDKFTKEVSILRDPESLGLKNLQFVEDFDNSDLNTIFEGY